MKYCFIFLFLFTALFWACTHDKGTGPDGGGDDDYALEGCWESFLIEEYTDSGWVSLWNGKPDTMVFNEDTSWTGHFYSLNPFDSSYTFGIDFGDVKLSADTVYLQSQSNLAEYTPYTFSIDKDTLKLRENEKILGTVRNFWVNQICDL